METTESLLLSCGAADAASVPADRCPLLRPYLLSRLGFEARSVCFGVVPYLTPVSDGERRVSSYAVSRDYHIYIRELGERFVKALQSAFPDARAAVFGDHSPYDEVRGAAAAGLGRIGKNGLLITEKYSSYVFILEAVTDLPACRDVREPKECENCGACARVCPGRLKNGGPCLSALTQKKGTLTPEEEELLRLSGCVWGCDRCQEVCPHTAAARRRGTLYTADPWFVKDALPFPDAGTACDPADFAVRAYSWRGRETFLRNLSITSPACQAGDGKRKLD